MTPLELPESDATIWSISYVNYAPRVVNYAPRVVNYAPRVINYAPSERL